MEDTIYYIHIDGKQKGPLTLEEMASEDIKSDTMVWRSGLPSWVQAHTLPEIVPIIEEKSIGLPPKNEYSGGSEPPIEQVREDVQTEYITQRNEKDTKTEEWFNWTPWAVVGTVIGFFTGIFGMIFGIVGLVKSNEANEATRTGSPHADDLNNDAKLWTLISVGISAFVALAILSYIVINFYIQLFNDIELFR